MFKQQNPPKAQDSSPSPFSAQSTATSTEPTAATVVAPAVLPVPPSSSAISTSVSSVTSAAVVCVAASHDNGGNLLVSEQEDNDVANTSMDDRGYIINEEDEELEAEGPFSETNSSNQRNTASSGATTAATSYAEGQVEVSDGDGADRFSGENGEHEDEDDDESEYSYDYEDDDDGGHYSSFIVTNHPPTQSNSSGNNNSSVIAASSSTGAAVVPQEEDDDTASQNHNENHIEISSRQAATNLATLNKTKNHQSGRNLSSRAVSGVEPDEGGRERTSSGVLLYAQSNNDTDNEENFQFASLQDTDPTIQQSKSSWKEPSQRAISMSLRAESEKTGGRRRLASDLYKIMMNDTNESGFSVESADEESLDRWTIRLFQFDEDSNLHKDMLILGIDHIELEMQFPDQYPFEPPFVQVVRPRFKKQTGFVMNGALCMELLTSDGWNPINDIESVIVSIRSLLVVGDGRLEAVANMPEAKREKLLAAALSKKENESSGLKRSGDHDDDTKEPAQKRSRSNDDGNDCKNDKPDIKGYSASEAKAAYSHLSSYHKKKGWSGWWAQRG